MGPFFARLRQYRCSAIHCIKLCTFYLVSLHEVLDVDRLKSAQTDKLLNMLEEELSVLGGAPECHGNKVPQNSLHKCTNLHIYIIRD